MPIRVRFWASSLPDRWDSWWAWWWGSSAPGGFAKPNAASPPASTTQEFVAPDGAGLNGLARPRRPEAVHHRSRLVALPRYGVSEAIRLIRPIPKHPNTPSSEMPALRRAGSTDERGTDAAGSLGS